MGYSFKNSKGKTYFLHTKDVILKGGREQTIYYFAKDERDNTCDLPDGKMIVADLSLGDVKKIEKISGDFISRPFIFNQNLFVIRNGSIIQYN